MNPDRSFTPSQWSIPIVSLYPLLFLQKGLSLFHAFRSKLYENFKSRPMCYILRPSWLYCLPHVSVWGAPFLLTWVMYISDLSLRTETPSVFEPPTHQLALTGPTWKFMTWMSGNILSFVWFINGRLPVEETSHVVGIDVSTFCPHSVFMCFVWIWEQTAIISLYSINWLVFMTEI